MNGSFSWERFSAVPIIGILRHVATSDIPNIARTAVQAGLTTLELTMNTAEVIEQLHLLRSCAGDVLSIGAGTVCIMADYRLALQAGAEFIVTPIVNPAIIRAAKEDGIPIFPGAYTPTEVFQAWENGADIVKIFPAGQLGPEFVRAMHGPFPQIPLLPTGGVTLDTLQEYLQAGAAGVGIGSPLFPKTLIEAGDWQGLEAHIRQFVSIAATFCDPA